MIDPMSFELDSKLAILDLLLDKYPTHVHQTNARGQTALHLASRAMRSDIVARLCQIGLRPDAADSSAATPIDLCRCRRDILGSLDTKYLLIKARTLEELQKTEAILLGALKGTLHQE